MAVSVVVAVGADRRRAGRARSPSAWRRSDRRRPPRCDMGPLVTGLIATRWRRISTHWRGRGARAGGGRPHRARRGRPGGFWLGPSLFDQVRPDMSIYPDESSGRCCRSCGWPSYEDALEMVNANPYGNGTAIFTNDGGAARRFQTEVEVGMVGINVPIPVPVLLLVRRLEELALRRQPCARHRGRPLLHPWQGRDEPLARPEPGGINLGFPAEHLRPGEAGRRRGRAPGGGAERGRRAPAGRSGSSRKALKLASAKDCDWSQSRLEASLTRNSTVPDRPRRA